MCGVVKDPTKCSPSQPRIIWSMVSIRPGLGKLAFNFTAQGPIICVVCMDCSRTGSLSWGNYALWRHSKSSTSSSVWMSLVSSGLFAFVLLICLRAFCTTRNTTCSFFPVLSTSSFMSRILMATSVSKKSLATASMIPAAEWHLRVRNSRRQHTAKHH